MFLIFLGYSPKKREKSQNHHPFFKKISKKRQMFQFIRGIIFGLKHKQSLKFGLG